jgi:hypothetical protein
MTTYYEQVKINARRVSLMTILAFTSACSSVEPIGNNAKPPIPPSECNVQVYATEAQAKEHGTIEEMCVIEGTSSGSFVHTPATAIKKHKNKACGCGADKVYVQSRQPMGMDVASVSMVAFRFVEQAPQARPDSETIRRAKLCQQKGGIWINDICQLEIL